MTRGIGGHSPANMTHHLKDVDFPAGKDDLLRCSKDNGADSDVLDAIKSIPEENCGSMADVMKAYGGEDTADRH